MKYDARACKFNMDTGCAELLLRDGRMISIDCTGIADALDVTMAQRSELDYLVYKRPTELCQFDSEWRPEGIFEECGWEPWTRNLNECWTLPLF